MPAIWRDPRYRDVLDELRRRGLVEDRAPAPRTAAKRTNPIDRDDYAREQHRKAAWLWSRRKPIAGTIAERYLREARGIARRLQV